MNKNKKTVIFDLDGTLANIDVRRDKSLKPNGKLNWDTFASPTSIMDWDTPNVPVIKMDSKSLSSQVETIEVLMRPKIG